jgi:putative redox protein
MYTSEVIYLGDLRTEAKHLASNHIIHTDAPIDNHGKGERFSPTDLLATSLAQCMITIMGIEASKIGLDLKGTKASVKKVMRLTPRKVAKIEITIHLPETAKEHHELMQESALNCPVALSLHPDVTKQVEFIYGLE